jgi:enolase
MKITSINARQIIDSRGNPTIEADLVLDGKIIGRAAVPSGASTGKYEALELRDGDANAYQGQGVLKAVENVKTTISDNLNGKEDLSQKELDDLMIGLDGTENKSKLGANAILAVSLAYAHAVAKAREIPLYLYIHELYGRNEMKMPRPMFNVMNGGKHADWATDIQEYMVIPLTSGSWAQSLQMGCEIFHNLEKLLKAKGYSVNVGNEGGFAPSLQSNQEALDLMVEAVEKSNYKLGTEVAFGFDAAASEFHNEATGNYDLKRDNKSLTPSQMVDWVENLSKNYPVVSFEDMFAQDDWESWIELTRRVGDKIQVVGDDLLVTNTKRIAEGIQKKACTALLVKLNQIGTLTETIAAMHMSEDAGWKNVVSHRSGETEDTTISHLVVGSGAGQLKTGAPSRGERTAKYNELIRIEEGFTK